MRNFFFHNISRNLGTSSSIEIYLPTMQLLLMEKLKEYFKNHHLSFIFYF